MLIPKKNPVTADIVFTPPELAVAIIEHYKPSGVLLDPAYGNGAFFENFPKGAVTDWCEIAKNKDFFEYKGKVDWVITNPPWSIIKEFLRHAYTLSDNIVFLAPITHFVTKARLREMKEGSFAIKEILCVPTPKANWPQSGFQLAAVHLKKDYNGPIYVS